MKRFAFKKIDAFAAGNSGGNPAGFISLTNGEAITEDDMQQIARQLKGFVSEVGYSHRIDESTVGLKYYSAEREVDFCGHATIAIMYDLIQNDPTLNGRETVHIVNNKGRLVVENRLKEENSVYIHAPKPVWTRSVPEAAAIAKHLTIAENDISTDFPVSLANAGLNTLLVPIKRLDTILSIAPDLEDLKKFCFSIGADIVEVFTPETAHEGHQYRTRVFAPTFGYLEDTATGSGNSAFGYYLKKFGFWKTDSLVIEQNCEREACNIVRLRFQTDGTDDGQILFGGPAITRIEGEYILP